MRSRRSGGSINWVLLVSGRFSVSETIIPKPGAFSYPVSTPPLSPFRWIRGKKSIRGYPMGGSKLQTRKRVLSVATMPLAVFAIVAGIITACASSEGSSRPQPQDTETRIAQAVAATVEVQSRTAQTVAATDTPSQPTAKHNPTSTLLPPPPQIVTDSMMAYTECVLNFASGSLSRPRINDFKALPYMSELLSPGAMASREILIRYQNEYLLDTLHNKSEICGLQVYSTEYIESQQQEYEILEASKAAGVMLNTGLLSPDMKHNCEEWEQSRHVNYRAARAGSIRRRGEESGLNFDYAWGKTKEHISDACAPYFIDLRTPDR